MNFKKQTIWAVGVKFCVEINGKEIARAYLYILKNNLHPRPFGLLEDVFVDENYRGRGVGTSLIEKAIEEVKNNNCYKLIATSRYSRPAVHKLYGRLGFKKHGIEFRMDFFS